MKTLENKIVYLVMTGAKKCSSIPGLVKEFIGEGAQVYTFLTEMAKEIANMGDLEMQGNNIQLDYSKNGQELPLEDIVLVAPSTFNTLNKITQGIADSYPLTIIASAIGKRKKVIFAPAMNRSLWEHPLTSRSLDTLQQWGCQVVWPETKGEEITMAPLEKLADVTYLNFSRVRYESKRLPLSEYDLKVIEENYPDFKSVGESLAKNGLIDSSWGFMSKKVGEGILVSSSGSTVGSLNKEDISLILGVEANQIIWKGTNHPSSESPLIWEIYQTFPETEAIIHTHVKKATYHPLMKPYVSEQYLRYGKFGELIKISDLLRTHNGFAIMRLHGELCLGNSLSHAFQKIQGKLEDVK